MALIAPNKANVPAIKGTIDKGRLKNRALEMLAQEEEDGEGHCSKVIDQILARAANTARFAKSDKDATSAGKWLWEIAFGKSPVATEEVNEDTPEVVFRINSKDKNLIKELSEREEVQTGDPEDKVVISIDDEPDMEF